MVNVSFLGRYGWLLVPLAGLGAALALCFFPLHLKLSSTIPALIAALATFGVWQFYRLKRPDPGISALAESATFLLVIMPPLAVINYATTMAARPLLDETFARMDALMGFDWMAHLAGIRAAYAAALRSAFSFSAGRLGVRPGHAELLHDPLQIEHLLRVACDELTDLIHDEHQRVARLTALHEFDDAVRQAAGRYVHFGPALRP